MKINEVMSSLRSVYDDWSKILVNPQFARIKSTVAWSGFSQSRILIRSPVMPSDITDLIEDSQYTFQIYRDGSIIRILYFYDKSGKKLESASLAFYSAKPAYKLSHHSPVSWLRIDYDPKRARGVLHHNSHIHLSGLPDSRFVVNGLLTPKQFIEFIMAYVYP